MRDYFAGLIPPVPSVPTCPQQPGTGQNPHKQRAVPGVPNVPTKNNDERKRADELDADAAEVGTELPHEQAEARHVRPMFVVRLKDQPDGFRLLGPMGYTIEDAWESCIRRFGADRVADVREYKPELAAKREATA